MSNKRVVVQAYGKSRVGPTQANPFPNVDAGAAKIGARPANEVEAIEVVAPRQAAPERRAVGEPGFVESLVPIWGSGRGLINDAQEGDLAGAGLNGLMLALDLAGAGMVRRGLMLGGRLMPGGKQGWKYVQQVFKKKKYLADGMQGHHAIIPNNGWGKNVHNSIKNHPLNIKPLPPERHMPIHQNSRNYGPRFGVAQRYWNGRPTWAKVFDGSTAVRPVEAVRDRK